VGGGGELKTGKARGPVKAAEVVLGVWGEALPADAPGATGKDRVGEGFHVLSSVRLRGWVMSTHFMAQAPQEGQRFNDRPVSV